MGQGFSLADHAALGPSARITLGHIPSFVRVPYATADEALSLRDTLDVRKLLDVAARRRPLPRGHALGHHVDVLTSALLFVVVSRLTPPTPAANLVVFFDGESDGRNHHAPVH